MSIVWTVLMIVWYVLYGLSIVNGTPECEFLACGLASFALSRIEDMSKRQ